MAEIKTSVPYINNPFLIGVNGINLLFLKAQSVAIALTILSVLAVIPSYTSPQEPSEAASGDLFTPEIILVIALIASLFIVIGTFVNGIMSYSAAKASKDESTTLKDALSAVASRFWSFLWLEIIMTFKVLAWSLLFIVPGVIKSIQYSLAYVAFFDKDLRGNAAIKHSVALTKGSLITTLGGQMFFTLITFGILDFLVGAATNTVLYRQFSHTPVEKRPQTHGLSIFALVLLILLVIVGMLAAIMLVAAGVNYATDPTLLEPNTL